MAEPVEYHLLDSGEGEERPTLAIVSRKADGIFQQAALDAAAVIADVSDATKEEWNCTNAAHGPRYVQEIGHRLKQLDSEYFYFDVVMLGEMKAVAVGSTKQKRERAAKVALAATHLALCGGGDVSRVSHDLQRLVETIRGKVAAPPAEARKRTLAQPSAPKRRRRSRSPSQSPVSSLPSAIWERTPSVGAGSDAVSVSDEEPKEEVWEVDEEEPLEVDEEVAQVPVILQPNDRLEELRERLRAKRSPASSVALKYEASDRDESTCADITPRGAAVTLWDANVKMEIVPLRNGASSVVEVASLRERRGPLVEWQFIYCPTAMWWQSTDDYSNEQICDWIRYEQNGQLMSLVSRGASLRFVIPGKPSLDSEEEDEISEYLQSSEGRVAAIGCSAGGMLALRLLRSFPGVGLVGAVSPAPLQDEEWGQVPLFVKNLSHLLSHSQKRLVLMWGDQDWSQTPLEPLQNHPGVTQLRKQKGHIGTLNRDDFEELLFTLQRLGGEAASPSASVGSAFKAEPVPSFPEDGAMPPPPPKAPVARHRKREGIVLRMFRELTPARGMLRDRDDQAVVLEFESIGGLDNLPREGDVVEYRQFENEAGHEAVNVTVKSRAQKETAQSKPSDSECWAAEQFLRRHALQKWEKGEPFTHSSMKGYRDSFARFTGKFKFPDDEATMKELGEAIAVFYRLSHAVPDTPKKLFLCEHPTDVYAFVEDIDVLGGYVGGVPNVMRNGPNDYDYELLKWRAKVLRKIFPGAEPRLMLYEACGMYQGHDIFKESYHLVWPMVMVDKQRAVAAREETVRQFEQMSEAEGHPLAKLLHRAKQKDENNSWERIFDISTTRPSIGARMPYSDKMSVTKEGRWVDNHRRVLPIAEIMFDFNNGEELPRCITVAGAEQRTPAEWAKNGMCRRTGKAVSYCTASIRAAEGQRNRRRAPGSGSTGGGGGGSSGSGGGWGGGRGGGGGGWGGWNDWDHRWGGGWGGTGGKKGGKGNRDGGKDGRGHRPYGRNHGSEGGRRSFGGTKEEFLDIIKQHAKGKFQFYETQTIQGGVQVRFGKQGTIDFMSEASKAVVLRGTEWQQQGLLPIISGWTQAG